MSVRGFPHEIVQKLLAGIARDPRRRVEQRQRRGRDHGLLHRPVGILLRSLEVRSRRKSRNGRGPRRQDRKLSSVPVAERDGHAAGREVLCAVDRVRREARLALFAVGDDGRARLLEAADRVADGGVEERLERVARDAAGPVSGHAFDQGLGSWNTSDRLGGERHCPNLSNFGRSRGMRRASIVLLALVATLAPAPAAAQPIDPALYRDLRWRLIGPFRGGWSLVAEGIPDDPATYYFGAAAGGVWKTEDAGQTWSPIFDRAGAASVGALAIAPSNPKVIYVGTGQIQARYDVASGDGMYRSDDGGATWRRIGLTDSRAIGRILVDPKNPDVALVAALGHMFGAEPRARALPDRGRRADLEPGPLRRREHGRRRSRRRSGEPRDPVRLAVAGPQLSLALLLPADGRAGERPLQVDRRRPHLGASLRAEAGRRRRSAASASPRRRGAGSGRSSTRRTSLRR